MTTVDALFDPARLEAAVSDGLVGVREHPDGDLRIYNYTPKAQYDRVWDDVTLACRGLVIDRTGRIVARPLAKFFNLDEHLVHVGALPDGGFTVWDKLDGSLIVVANDPDHGLVVASRGSFISDQAGWARELLADVDPDVLAPGRTYLFELLHPGNRIVVDYGRRQELVLLAAVDVASGRDLLPDHPELSGLGFTVAEQVHVDTVDELAGHDRPNREGYVVRYPDGTRVKVKHDEYCRLHKLLTGVTPKTVWELLRDGRDPVELADNVPDEFHDWLSDVTAELRTRHGELLAEIDAAYATLKAELGDAERKQWAVTMKQRRLPGHVFAGVFARLDGNDPAGKLWKLVRPDGDDPAFWNDAAA